MTSINLATLGKVRYPPELLIDTDRRNLAANQFYGPAVLDLRGFRNQFVRVKQLSVATDAQVEMRLHVDDDRFSQVLAATPAFLRDIEAEATNYVGLTFMATALKNNWTSIFNLWVYQPTIAQKLARGSYLTPEENAIAQKYNIADSVEKGVLPLGLDYQVSREYVHKNQVMKARQMALGATKLTVDTLMPKPNEIVVLTGFSCDPGLLADNIHVSISRDDDVDLCEFEAFPMTLIQNIPCFIPARRELKIDVVADGVVAAWNVRYTVMTCRLTNTLKARWGLLPKEALPGDVWEKVRGGIL